MPTDPISYVSPAGSRATAVRSISWGAIIAGCVAALSVHLLATLLGMGLGLGMVDPLTNDNPAADFSVSVGIAWSVSALIALWVGGWVAGRGARTTNAKLGGLHGLLVWSTATVVTAVLLSSSAGALIGGAAKLVGKGAAVAGKGVANIASEAGDEAGGGAMNMLTQFAEQNSNFIGTFLEDLNAGGQGQRQVTATGRREIGWALFRVFNEAQSARTPAVRDAAVRAVTENTGIAEADARRRIDELIASYDRAQEDLKAMRDQAEQKAREIADRSSRAVAHAAIWTVVAFLIGAASAMFGGKRGANRAWHDAYPETTEVVPPLT